MIHLKSANEIAILRECNQIVAEILNTLKRHCRPGITTLELDKIAEDLTLKHKAKAAFKGYNGFPATLCTSVNHQVVHGIPSKQVLREGDIVSVDYGVFYRGFYGDAALTLPVGHISPATERLLQTTRESLMLGIAEGGSRQPSGGHLSGDPGPRRRPRLFPGEGILRAWHREKPARRTGRAELRSQWARDIAEARPGPGHRAYGEPGHGQGPGVARSLDGGDSGRQAVSSFRAQRCHHREWSGDPEPGNLGRQRPEIGSGLMPTPQKERQEEPFAKFPIGNDIEAARVMCCRLRHSPQKAQEATETTKSTKVTKRVS